jgi:MoxR-like ATPase
MLTEDMATRLTTGLRALTTSDSRVTELTGEAARDFHWVRSHAEVATFKITLDTFEFFVSIATNPELHRQHIFINRRLKGSSNVMLSSSEAGGLVWRYRPAKQSGDNSKRLAAFRKQVGADEIAIPIPEGDVRPFALAIERCTKARDVADKAGDQGAQDADAPARPAPAAELEIWFPDPAQRKLAVEALCQAIKHAHKLNPRSWCLTRPTSEPMFRLNVGNARVLDLRADSVDVQVTLDHDDAALGTSLEARTDKLNAPLKSKRYGRNGVVRVAPSALPLDAALLAGRDGIVRAASTHLTPWARKHDPALIECLRTFDPEVPEPNHDFLGSPGHAEEEPSSDPDLDDAVDLDPDSEPLDEPEAPTFADFLARLEARGLTFSAELCATYLLALRLRRFVLLSGISGTGKTQLALELARTFSSALSTPDNLAIVPVRPDWTDSRGVLGFLNPLTDAYVRTPTLDLVLRASSELKAAAAQGRPPRPFFLVLDEMNLARAEHYFADVLSAMESNEAIPLHDQPQRTDVPARLQLPENLFITGTINVDETTYLFSPKILDRAFVIEFNQVDLGALDRVAASLNTNKPTPTSPTLGIDPLQAIELSSRVPPDEWTRFTALGHGHARKLVGQVHAALIQSNRHFGFRVAREIARFVVLAGEGKAGDLEAAIDLALLGKVLPKLSGTHAELDAVLARLLELTAGNASGLPRTHAKLTRMRARLEAHGFTSFIE